FALRPDQIRPYAGDLSNRAPFYIRALPAAGLPNEFREYDQTPEEMAEIVEEFAQSGFLNIIGGCCGSTPDHSRVLAERVSKHPPRRIPEIKPEIGRAHV